MRSQLMFNLNTLAVKTACVALLTSFSIVAFAQMQVAPPAAPTLAAPSPTATTPNTSSEPAIVNVQKKFIERFGNMPVKNVRTTSFGLFEVQLGNDLIYTDADVNFIFDGHVIDAATRRDLTQARLDELSAVDFKSLPFDLAIKQVRGDGKRQVAIFEDPNCGYCKKLRQNIDGIDNLTVYSFMLPILSDDSTQKVKNVWCAKDRGTTWDNWMLKGINPPKLDCEVPIQKMLDLAKSLQVQGTPAIFFADGTRVPGAISKEEFEKRLQ
jgi:thiol:disulfide interchange protein DsbC